MRTTRIDIAHGGRVMRQVDAIPHRRSAWPRILALPLEAWTGPKQRWFRIVADRITGRRVGPSA